MNKIKLVLAAMLLLATVFAVPAHAESWVAVCYGPTQDYQTNGPHDCNSAVLESDAPALMAQYKQWVVNQGYYWTSILYTDADRHGNRILLYSEVWCYPGRSSVTVHLDTLWSPYDPTYYGHYWQNRVSSIANAASWSNGSQCDTVYGDGQGHTVTMHSLSGNDWNTMPSGFDNDVEIFRNQPST